VKVVVVSGTPGSGKSIVGMQYLWQGLLSAEKCLYISVEQKKEKILRQAHQFGWDFESYEANGQLTIITLRSHVLKLLISVPFFSITTKIMISSYAEYA
jgi:KaiC/GvpD/RAD55 family RecA-like ATPase